MRSTIEYRSPRLNPRSVPIPATCLVNQLWENFGLYGKGILTLAFATFARSRRERLYIRPKIGTNRRSIMRLRFRELRISIVMTVQPIEEDTTEMKPTSICALSSRQEHKVLPRLRGERWSPLLFAEYLPSRLRQTIPCWFHHCGGLRSCAPLFSCSFWCLNEKNHRNSYRKTVISISILECHDPLYPQMSVGRPQVSGVVARPWRTRGHFAGEATAFLRNFLLLHDAREH